jgi:putative hydroxymethylpyrimidine transport system substrate-binding protein
VLLDWFPNPDHISLYLAKKDGDFTAQGLNVTLQAPSSTSDAIKLVSLGQIPLAISYEPEVLISEAKKLDVTAVAALVPTSLNSLIISGKSGVTSPAGLTGKKIGSSGLDTDNAFITAITKKYGVNEKSLKIITVSQGLVPAMVSGQVDAIIGGYQNVEAIQLADRGLKPLVYPVSVAGVPAYDELVVIANTSKLKSDPTYQAMVKSFLAGLAKGDAATQADPAAALAALSPVAKGYSASLLKKMVDVTAPLLKNSAGFGAMDVAQWQSFADWMKSDGLISTSVNASLVVNTSFLPTG